ncbi:MAG: sodium-dependent transporter [Muribaculaceae bacterium]|nr:sodium-dependent transporter [Muribaculaceae bacterium]
MASNNSEFSSKIGLIAATVGSAVGLGNVWRFPAETQAHGGAAFLLVYVICVLLFGIPVMLGEFAIGRAGKSDAIDSYKKLSPGKPWWISGFLGILCSYLILTFYMVVSGWTLEYLYQSITGELFSPIPGVAEGSNLQFADRMQEYVAGVWPPMVWTWITIAICGAVLCMGVQKGIERASNILMPLLFLILIVLCVNAMSLPKAAEGLEYFFNPDFSKITPKVCISALGQAFFSLSLGMGTLITYGSYFRKDTNLTRTAFTVSILDMAVAILVGMIIFPGVMSFGLEGESFDGSALVFVTFPEIFNNMWCPQLWSSLFFILLAVAALTSSISIAEVSIAYFSGHFNVKRVPATCAVLIPLVLLSSLSSLSNGVLSDWTIFGYTIFGACDAVTANILMPLGALIMAVYLGWFAPKNLMKDQLTNGGTIRNRFAGTVIFLLKWVTPILILVIFIASLFM